MTFGLFCVTEQGVVGQVKTGYVIKSQCIKWYSKATARSLVTKFMFKSEGKDWT